MANRKQEIDSQGKIVRGEYNASLPTYGDGAVVTPQYDSSGRIIPSPVDVEIGAVELKDGSSDVRATINAANTARTTATTVVVTEPIDGEGHVVDWSDLDDIKTAVQIIDNAIAGNEMQVDVITMPTVAVTGTFWQATQPVSIADGADVTLGAKADARNTATDTTEITVMQVLKEISYMEQNPATRAVTNAGTFVVQENGSALTALQLIDDVVYVDDADWTPATSKVAMVGAEFDDTTPDS